MKTITLSNDQLEAVRNALVERISHLERVLGEPDIYPNDYVMVVRDDLDVARQALDAVQS